MNMTIAECLDKFHTFTDLEIEGMHRYWKDIGVIQEKPYCADKVTAENRKKKEMKQTHNKNQLVKNVHQPQKIVDSSSFLRSTTGDGRLCNFKQH